MAKWLCLCLVLFLPLEPRLCEEVRDDDQIPKLAKDAVLGIKDAEPSVNQQSSSYQALPHDILDNILGSTSETKDSNQPRNNIVKPDFEVQGNFGNKVDEKIDPDKFVGKVLSGSQLNPENNLTKVSKENAVFVEDDDIIKIDDDGITSKTFKENKHELTTDSTLPVPDTQRPEENDEPSRFNSTDFVQLKLDVDTDSVNENFENADYKNNKQNGSPGNSEITANSYDKHEEKEAEDDDRFLGNPPIMSDTDLLKLANSIPKNLSQGERELWRKNTSKSLGLSALDPGLARPIGLLNENFHFEKQGKEDHSTESSPLASRQSSSSTVRPVKPDKNEIDILSSLGKENDQNAPKEPPVARVSEEATNDAVDPDKTDANLEGEFYNSETTPQSDTYSDIADRVNRNENYEKDNDDESDDDEKDYYGDDYEEDEEEAHYVGGDVFITEVPSTDSKKHLTQNDGKLDAAGLSDGFSAGQNENRLASIDADIELKPDDSSRNFEYEEKEDDDWFYNPEGVPNKDMLTLPTTITSTLPGFSDPAENVFTETEAQLETGALDKEKESQANISPSDKENPLSKEDIHSSKKPLQAPKGTIVLYTILIICVISGIVIFSVWKNPFKGLRGAHLTTHAVPVVRSGEEGKRLLDHPFV